MALVIDTSKKNPVTIDGTVYELKKPTFKDSEIFMADIKKAGDDELKQLLGMKKLLISAGLPEDILGKLAMSDVMLICEDLQGKS